MQDGRVLHPYYKPKFKLERRAQPLADSDVKTLLSTEPRALPEHLYRLLLSAPQYGPAWLTKRTQARIEKARSLLKESGTI